MSDREQCPDCEGTGLGPCAECGDGSVECACDDQTCDDCDSCEGSGYLGVEVDGADEDGDA